MNLGNLYGQKRDYKQAIVHYANALQISPHNPANNKFSLPKDGPLDPERYSYVAYSGKLNSEPAFIDAHTNIAVMYIQVDEIDKAYSYC